MTRATKQRGNEPGSSLSVLPLPEFPTRSTYSYARIKVKRTPYLDKMAVSESRGLRCKAFVNNQTCKVYGLNVWYPQNYMLETEVKADGSVTPDFDDVNSEEVHIIASTIPDKSLITESKSLALCPDQPSIPKDYQKNSSNAFDIIEFPNVALQNGTTDVFDSLVRNEMKSKWSKPFRHYGALKRKRTQNVGGSATSDSDDCLVKRARPNPDYGNHVDKTIPLSISNDPKEHSSHSEPSDTVTVTSELNSLEAPARSTVEVNQNRNENSACTNEENKNIPPAMNQALDDTVSGVSDTVSAKNPSEPTSRHISEHCIKPSSNELDFPSKSNVVSDENGDSPKEKLIMSKKIQSTENDSKPVCQSDLKIIGINSKIDALQTDRFENPSLQPFSAKTNSNEQNKSENKASEVDQNRGRNIFESMSFREINSYSSKNLLSGLEISDMDDCFYDDKDSICDNVSEIKTESKPDMLPVDGKTKQKGKENVPSLDIAKDVNKSFRLIGTLRPHNAAPKPSFTSSVEVKVTTETKVEKVENESSNEKSSPLDISNSNFSIKVDCFNSPEQSSLLKIELDNETIRECNPSESIYCVQENPESKISTSITDSTFLIKDDSLNIQEKSVLPKLDADSETQTTRDINPLESIRCVQDSSLSKSSTYLKHVEPESPKREEESAIAIRYTEKESTDKKISSNNVQDKDSGFSDSLPTNPVKTRRRKRCTKNRKPIGNGKPNLGNKVLNNHTVKIKKAKIPRIGFREGLRKRTELAFNSVTLADYIPPLKENKRKRRMSRKRREKLTIDSNFGATLSPANGKCTNEEVHVGIEEHAKRCAQASSEVLSESRPTVAVGALVTKSKRKYHRRNKTPPKKSRKSIASENIKSSNSLTIDTNSISSAISKIKTSMEQTSMKQSHSIASEKGSGISCTREIGMSTRTFLHDTTTVGKLGMSSFCDKNSKQSKHNYQMLNGRGLHDPELNITLLVNPRNSRENRVIDLNCDFLKLYDRPKTMELDSIAKICYIGKSKRFSKDKHVNSVVDTQNSKPEMGHNSFQTGNNESFMALVQVASELHDRQKLQNAASLVESATISHGPQDSSEMSTTSSKSNCSEDWGTISLPLQQTMSLPNTTSQANSTFLNSAALLQNFLAFSYQHGLRPPFDTGNYPRMMPQGLEPNVFRMLSFRPSLFNTRLPLNQYSPALTVPSTHTSNLSLPAPKMATQVVPSTRPIIDGRKIGTIASNGTLHAEQPIENTLLSSINTHSSINIPLKSPASNVLDGPSSTVKSGKQRFHQRVRRRAKVPRDAVDQYKRAIKTREKDSDINRTCKESEFNIEKARPKVDILRKVQLPEALNISTVDLTINQMDDANDEPMTNSTEHDSTQEIRKPIEHNVNETDDENCEKVKMEQGESVEIPSSQHLQLSLKLNNEGDKLAPDPKHSVDEDKKKHDETEHAAIGTKVDANNLTRNESMSCSMSPDTTTNITLSPVYEKLSAPKSYCFALQNTQSSQLGLDKEATVSPSNEELSVPKSSCFALQNTQSSQLAIDQESTVSPFIIEQSVPKSPCSTLQNTKSYQLALDQVSSVSPFNEKQSVPISPCSTLQNTHSSQLALDEVSKVSLYNKELSVSKSLCSPLQHTQSSQLSLDQVSSEMLWKELMVRKALTECVCGASFRSSALYMLHGACHNTDEPHICATCGERSLTWLHFFVHLYNHEK